jgi:hypothetical protein
MSTFITTHSGLYVDVLEPDIDKLLLADVIHSLSLTCRFNGHCDYFYSTLQHSLNVAELCSSAEAKRAGLVHEFAEAVYGDVVTPLKYSIHLDNYRLLEKNLQRLLYMRLLGKATVPAQVKHADTVCFLAEAYTLNKTLFFAYLRDNYYGSVVNSIYAIGMRAVDHIDLFEEFIIKLSERLLLDEMRPEEVRTLFYAKAAELELNLE